MMRQGGQGQIMQGLMDHDETGIYFESSVKIK